MNFSSLVFFRVTQELLTNIAKHASASLVHINVQVIQNSLQLSVQDNGAGFDLTWVLEQKECFGLLGVRERMLALGGELQTETTPGRGCCMTVIIPVEGSER